MTHGPKKRLPGYPAESVKALIAPWLAWLRRFRQFMRRGRKRWLIFWAKQRAAWRRWRSLGGRGERAAARFLRRRHGMIIVGASVRVGRGELDLIAVDAQTIVFVEVKTRTSHVRGHPAEAVDDRKQQQLTRLALRYLSEHRLLEYDWRFDVVAITWPEDSRRPQIEHFPAAFSPADLGSMYV